MIENPENMSHERLKKALKKEAQDQRQETDKILSEMERSKYSGKVMKEKKTKTAANREDREKFLRDRQ